MSTHADINTQQEEKGVQKFRDFEEILEYYHLDFRFETFLDFLPLMLPKILLQFRNLTEQ